MKKKNTCSILILVILLCCIPVCLASAADTDDGGRGQVADQAGLLTGAEVKNLQELAEDAGQSTHWDIMLVSTQDAGGMGAVSYAEAWADAHTVGDNGVICLIDMENRELVVSAFGEAIYYLTDQRKEDILDAAYEGASEGNYYKAFQSMAEGVRDAYWSGIPDDQYTYDEETGEIIEYASREKRLVWWEILLAAGFAAAAGGITASAVIGRYRLKWGGYQYSWRENGAVRLSQKRDEFVNQIVTHRKIPKNNGSGGSKGHSGRSTIHTGSGGRTFSSSSRKF